MLKKTLGQLLLDRNLITATNLREYKEISQKQSITLERYVVENGLISDDVMAQLYAQELNLRLITVIDEKQADPALLIKIPLKFLKDNAIIPLKGESTEGLICAIADPLHYQAIDELSLIFKEKPTVAIAPRKKIIDALNHFYPLESGEEMIEDLEEENDVAQLSFGEIDERDIMSGANEAPIIKLVNYILYQAVKMRASDIHISPQEKDTRIRYRVDGIMHTMMTPPKRIQSAIASRIKIMGGMNIAEKRKTQDGRIEIKAADQPIDIRVSVLPAKFGENIVMRLLYKDRNFASMDNLGFSIRDLKTIESIIASPNGIILVTGPTGSGKTTTLYSVLNTLNTPTVNIITVEDPVEYQMAGITQVQVNEKAELTFAKALRSILRQDPDIIMIGETRDQETAQIAIQSALTGHLVLTTLHTNNAAASITRLIDMGIEPFLISSSVVGIIAQRLVRQLCPLCKEKYKPTDEMLTLIGLQNTSDHIFYRAKGCPECNNLGYKGRVVIFEIMKMTDSVAKLTMERASTTEIRKQAMKDGMTLMLEDGLAKAQKGLTTIEEVLSVATIHEN